MNLLCSRGARARAFSTAQDKIAWFDPFVAMRPNLFSNIHLES
jgi:hypothetical protein